jgi:hypothetical protein
MEGVRAAHRCGASSGNDRGDPVGGIGTDVGDLRAPVFTEEVEERLQGCLVPPRCGPDQAAGVVVDHDGEEPVAALVADLVDPDPAQPREPVHSRVDVGRDPGDDRAHGPPGDPHQLGDRGLRARHREPGDLVVERAGVPGVVPRPGHRGDHDPVLRARHPRRVGFQHRADHAEVQGPPPSPALPLVIAAAASAATTAPASSRP